MEQVIRSAENGTEISVVNITALSFASGVVSATLVEGAEVCLFATDADLSGVGATWVFNKFKSALAHALRCEMAYIDLTVIKHNAREIWEIIK